MGVKKLALVLTIILFSMTARYFLENIYNSQAVEFHFNGKLSMMDLKKLDNSDYQNKIENITVNWTMPYQNQNLIMTTGFDFFTKDIPIIKGTFLKDINRNEVVIGDKVAGQYFTTLDVIGKNMNVLGNTYSIIGIIKNSNSIYIPYDDTLQGIGWQTKVVKVCFKYDEYFYLSIDKMRNQLKIIGLQIFDTVIYKEIMNGYMNLAILSLLYVLIGCCYKLIKQTINSVNKIKREYIKKMRVLELKQYLIIHSVSILKTIGMCILSIILIQIIYKIIGYLYIPASVIPDNLFSLTSFLDIIQIKFQEYELHITNGVDGILFDTSLINAAFAILLCGILSFFAFSNCRLSIYKGK